MQDIRADEAKHDWRGEAASILNRIADHIAKDQQQIDSYKSEVEEIQSGYNPGEIIPDEEAQELWRLNANLRTAE